MNLENKSDSSFKKGNIPIYKIFALLIALATSHPHPPYNGADTRTDLYYTTVDGNDHYPDIFIGRISVDTMGEAGDVIDKILAYEQNPPATPANVDYYTDYSLVQLFEDDAELTPATGIIGNSREDFSFRIIEFAEEIRTYLQNNGYATTRIYDQSGNVAAGPLGYEDGTNMPANLTIAGGFPWNGATADITNEITAGKKKVKEIKNKIVEEFEVTPQQAEKDLIDYLQQLKQIETIIEG